jgi:hypothetical protein
MALLKLPQPTISNITKPMNAAMAAKKWLSPFTGSRSFLNIGSTPLI